MADTYGKLGSAGTVTDRHAQISRIPWLDGVPGEEFSVFQTDFTVGVNDNRGVVRVFIRIRVSFHDREYTVDTLFFAGFAEGLGLFSGNIAEKFVGEPFGCIQALCAVFGENNKLRAGISCLCRMQCADNFFYLPVNVCPAVDNRNRHLNCCCKKSFAWLVDTSYAAHENTSFFRNSHQLTKL